MDARTKLQDCISNMSEESVQKLLETAEAMMIAEGNELTAVPIAGARSSFVTERNVANRGIIASIV